MKTNTYPTSTPKCHVGAPGIDDGCTSLKCDRPSLPNAKHDFHMLRMSFRSIGQAGRKQIMSQMTSAAPGGKPWNPRTSAAPGDPPNAFVSTGGDGALLGAARSSGRTERERRTRVFGELYSGYSSSFLLLSRNGLHPSCDGLPLIVMASKLLASC